MRQGVPSSRIHHTLQRAARCLPKSAHKCQDGGGCRSPRMMHSCARCQQQTPPRSKTSRNAVPFIHGSYRELHRASLHAQSHISWMRFTHVTHGYYSKDTSNTNVHSPITRNSNSAASSAGNLARLHCSDCYTLPGFCRWKIPNALETHQMGNLRPTTVDAHKARYFCVRALLSTSYPIHVHGRQKCKAHAVPHTKTSS